MKDALLVLALLACLHAGTAESQVRQNFPEECEAAINKHINMELYASYVYQSMAFHFGRDDIALPGLAKFFRQTSDEERGQAEKMMKYQNMRGGRLVLQDVKAPAIEWKNGLAAMEDALALEKKVNEALLGMHNIAANTNDPQTAAFLEGQFLKGQVEEIKKIADLITKMKRAGEGLGEHLFDKELQ